MGGVKRRHAGLLLAVFVAAAVAIVGASVSSAASSHKQASIVAALVSDVGRFNDKSFNQSQLAGLNRAKAELGITALPLQSNAVSDYIPNLTTAVRRKAAVVISAGYLLANATATVAKKFPNTNFAITDYSAYDAPFGDKKGKPLFKNVEGLTYASQESGCLVGVLAALKAKEDGGNAIGAVGGLKIPSVDTWIAGYKFCGQKAVPGLKVLIGYSQDFVAIDKCKTVATNQLSQGAKVLFQIAGLCGQGVLKAADEANAWGIGVDVDQYNDAKRVLTSGVKHVEVGVYNVIKQAKDGKFKGGTNLEATLKNGGMDVGRINPSVPKADIATMNKYKAQIIAGTLKVPSTVS